MAIAIAVTSVSVDGNELRVKGKLTFSGNYVTGGDTIDWTTIIGKEVGPRVVILSGLPVVVDVGGSSGHEYGYVAGTTLANSKVKVFGQQPTSATAGIIPLDEIAAAAYPASITGDTNIQYEAVFPKPV